MFPLDSIFVTGRPSSRVPHVIFRCSHTDLFVFMRLPQFSNNFTSHIENGPGLTFGSHGFRQKSAFLDQPGSRNWFGLPLASPLRLRGAQDCRARSFTIRRRPCRSKRGQAPKQYLEMRVKLQIAVCGTRVAVERVNSKNE
jgi:hypothetical protein